MECLHYDMNLPVAVVITGFPFDRLLRFYDFREINRAIADAKRGITIKPVLRIHHSGY